jgi:hypothetical protein
MYRATKILDPEGKAEYFDESWSFGTLGPEKHHLELETLLELHRTDIYHVITESFQDRPGKQTATELISRDYIGVIDLWGRKNECRVIKQTVSMAKGFVSDDKLKAMDLWSSSKHSRDATRHLVLYMVNKLQMTWLVDSWEKLT